MLSVLQKAIRPMSRSRDIGRPRVVVDPGRRRRLLLGNRDISGPSLRSFARTAPGRPEAEADDERPGEVGLAHSSSEACERSGARRRGASGAKGGIKENADQQTTVRTQSREAVSHAQARIRDAAIQRSWPERRFLVN